MIILQRNDCENQLILKASSIFFNKNIHFSKVCIIQMKGAIKTKYLQVLLLVRFWLFSFFKFIGFLGYVALT